MDTTGPSQIAEASKRERLSKDQDADDLRWIMSTPQGRRFLGNLIYDPARFLGGGTGVANTVFSQSHASMAAMEGARDVSLRLLACVEAVDFELAMTIRKERWIEAKGREIQVSEAAKEDEPVDLFAVPKLDGPAL